MAGTSDFVPNLEEIMEEYVHPEEETRQEEPMEKIPTEAPEAPAVSEEGTNKGKGKAREEEVEEFVSEEAYSNWKKHYANKGFVAERRFRNPITPFKEMIEQRGWEALCAHQKSGYVAVVREFYSNLVGRKDNTVFVRGVWVPYGAKAINEAYRMAGHKHRSKFKKLLENPNLDKIAKKLTDGKAQLRQEKGGPKTLNRGSLTEEAKVWFYFLASVLVPTRHLSTVREQEAIMLYAILKGYKINIGTIIENSIMRYHEGNKRGVIPHPATVTVLCLKAGVKGAWETKEEVPLTSPLLLTGVSKGPRSQKKKGPLIKTREEAPAARQEEENSENPVETNTFTFADNEGQNEGSPMDFSFPLASYPPVQNRTFREQGESSRGAQENNSIMEMLLSMQSRMEEREKRWSIQQKFREDTYEVELKRRDQQWEEELQRREEKFESELKRREQEWEEEQKRKEEQMKEVLQNQGEDFRKEMEKRDKDLLKKLQLSHEAFYNNQFNRDNQLLGIIKERDAKQEEQIKENINGFKFLYMSLLKDFETKMEGRDKVLDDNDAYMRKMWLENLDLINNNLSKFLEVMTELEKNMNTLGMRQDELNKKVDLTNELAQEEQTDKEKAKGKRRIEVNIPEFSPKLDTLDLDPPNIYTGKQKRKK